MVKACVVCAYIYKKFMYIHLKYCTHAACLLSLLLYFVCCSKRVSLRMLCTHLYGKQLKFSSTFSLKFCSVLRRRRCRYRRDINIHI